MNKHFFGHTAKVLALGGALAVAGIGCGGGSSSPGGVVASDATTTLGDYTDDAVVTTYQTLDNQATALKTAVDTLVANVSEANLTAAQAAWRATRVPWERSEAYLFGPVDALGIDPAIDSWPVNKVDLDAVLASQQALTEQSVSALDNTLKGFHTIEYLLFNDGNNSNVAANIVAALNGNQRRRDYLAAATAALKTSTNQLITAWNAGATPYANTFKTAGANGNQTYASQKAAMQEMITGMVTIADEVAAGKINGPFAAQDVTQVESQFSFNSLTDFTNNIEGIRIAWLADYNAGTTKNSLRTFVNGKNAALATQVDNELTAAITALGNIQEPFRDSVTNAGQAANINAAIAAITQLKNTLEGDVSALVNATTFSQ